MQNIVAGNHPWFANDVALGYCLCTCWLGEKGCKHGHFAGLELDKTKLSEAILGPLRKVSEDANAAAVLFLAINLVKGEVEVKVTVGFANRECLVPLSAVNEALWDRYR